MKTIISLQKLLATLILIVACSFNTIAQLTQTPYCPEPRTSKERQLRMIQNNRNNLLNSSLATGKQIRVYFIICANDNGTESAATDAEVLQEFATMQKDFAPGNICFVNAGIGRINNTVLNHIDVENNDDAEDLFEARKIPGTLTIFFTAEIRGNNPSSGGKIGGLAFYKPSTFCLVSGGSLGGHTSSHEAGHCLGLYHTFAKEGLSYENISGSNCDMSGDFICDTKADPYVFKAEQNICFSSSDGVYTGTCEDSEGKRLYSPPYTNIMSYWHKDPETFTSGQFAVIHNTIETEDEGQEIASSTDLIMYTATYNFEYIYKSAINSLTTLGDVKLLSLTKAGLFAKKTVLTPGFQAKPVAGGFTIIRATVCTGLSSTLMNAPVYNQPTSLRTDNIMTGSKLLIYPNPSTGQFTLSYKQDKMFNAVINIRTNDGRLVYTQRKNSVAILQQNINLKSKGIYLVEVYTGEQRLRQKIVVQ